MTDQTALCPQCRQPLTPVGKFWICPEHGQVSLENPSAPMRIFLSYGHDANDELVLRVKSDLERRGHDVWFDKSDIRSGDDWRRAITEGIAGSTRVLAFLSKHSVRDPGVCLDELAIAIGVKGGNIQTILVESETEVKPPPSIAHIQWLDMHDWKEQQAAGEAAWGVWYQAKLAEIVRVTESDESRRFAGEIETLKEHLKPISSDARISALLSRGFVGRGWVAEAIERWRDADRTSRLFWISGDPGVGKSAFAAQLTHFGRDKVIAAQFVEWDKLDHRDARRVVRSLAFQLATRLPDYRKLLLTLPEIAELDRKDPAELFDYLLANPLRSAVHGGRERYLIVIDALDEAGDDGHNPLVEMLARNGPRLPDWLSFVVTSRPESAVKTPLQGLNPFVLDTMSEANRADIRDYVRHQLAPQLTDRPDAGRLVEQILEKSEGVFLYVERVCDDVQHNRFSLDRPEQFPQGLGGIFYDYFRRQFPDVRRFHNDIRPALRAILAVREPLPVEILRHLFKWQAEELDDLASALGSLFAVTSEAGTQVIKPYHKSLVDWLADNAKAGAYFVNVADGHRMLAKYFREQADPAGDGTWKGDSPRALGELPHHQARGQMWTELQSTLCDLMFIEAKCARGMTYGLVHDYEDAIRLVGHPEALASIEEFSRFLNAQAHNFARFASIAGYVRQQAFNEAAGRVFAAANSLTECRNASRVAWFRLVKPPSQPSSPRGLRRTLFQGDVTRAVAITPNGCYAASGGDDRIVRFWSLHDGVALGELATHKVGITAVSISSDGTLVASGDRSGRVVVWTPPSQGACFELPGHSAEVMSMRLAGHHLAACYADGRVRLWRHHPIDLELEFTIEGAGAKITTAAFSPDLAMIAVGFEDGTIEGWRCLKPVSAQRAFRVRHEGAKRRRQHQEMARYERELPPGLRGPKICGLCLSATGNRMFSCGDSDEVISWDLAGSSPQPTLAFKTDGWSLSIASNAEGLVAVNGSPLGILRILDARSPAANKTCKGHGNWVLSVALAADASVAVSAGLDGSVKVWSVQEPWEPPSEELPDREVDCIYLTAEGRTVLLGGYAPSLRASVHVWDVEKRTHVHSFAGGMCSDTIAVSPDESLVAAVGTNAIPHVWQLGSRTEVVHRPGGGTNTPMEFSPDGAAIVTGGDGFNEAAEVWLALSGKTLRIVSDPGAKEYFRRVTFYPDGRSLAAVGGNGAIHVVDGATGRRRAIISGHWDLALPGPDARSLLALASNGTLHVYPDFPFSDRPWMPTARASYAAAIWSRAGREVVTIQSSGLLETIRPSRQALEGAIPTGGTEIRLAWEGTFVAILGGEHWLALYRLPEHDLVAQFVSDTNISSASEFTPAGRIALGESNGQFRVLQVEGASPGLPITTAAYWWNWEQGDWAEQPQVRCPACRRCFVPHDSVLNAVRSLANLTAPGRSAWLDLPEAAWEAGDLMTPCRCCGQMLRMNPFIVDTRDHYR